METKELKQSIQELLTREKQEIRNAIRELAKISTKFHIVTYGEVAGNVFLGDGWTLIKNERYDNSYDCCFNGKRCCEIAFREDKNESVEAIKKNELFKVMFNFIDVDDHFFEWEWIRFLSDGKVFCGGKNNDYASGKDYIQKKEQEFLDFYKYRPNETLDQKEGIELIREMVAKKNSVPLFFVGKHY